VLAFARSAGAAVNEQEQKELMELCVDLIAEKDPEKFDELVKAMNALMAKKEERIRPRQ
jgi:phage terminase large subunit-like protein